jgi:hypothetical protein
MAIASKTEDRGVTCRKNLQRMVTILFFTPKVKINHHLILAIESAKDALHELTVLV